MAQGALAVTDNGTSHSCDAPNFHGSGARHCAAERTADLSQVKAREHDCGLMSYDSSTGNVLQEMVCMIQCSLRLLIGVSLLVLFTVEARAQTKQDEGLWLMFAGQGEFTALDEDLRDFRWWLDVQPRFTDDADGLKQTLVRPGLGYAFTDNAVGWMGYAWVRTEQNGSGHSQEHRIWQQLTWSPDIGRFSLASRTRLEQRFLDTGDNVGWRFRQFVKVALPIAAKSRLFLAAYNEAFFDLNDTDWGQRAGFSQNRLFVGLGWKFDSPAREGSLSVEVGYLNQFIHNQSKTDRINHILSINLFWNL